MTKNEKKVLYFVISAIVFGVISLNIFYSFYKPNMFSNRQMYLYKDESGVDTIMIVEMIKYNIIPYYYHYEYSLNMVNDVAKTDYINVKFNSMNKDFQPKSFITNIENLNYPNNLNENFIIEINYSGKKYAIDLKNMTADFLINNSLERLTYINMGTDNISIDGVDYKMDYALNKTLSTDMKAASLDKDTKSKNSVLFLSNGKGQLYYTDVTDVVSGKDDYTSHAWFIHKSNNATYKIVGKDKVILEEDYNKVSLSLPDFNNTKINIKNTDSYSQYKIFNTLVRGELNNELGQEKLIGYSMNYDDTR